jgi:hypothetical protein
MSVMLVQPKRPVLNMHIQAVSFIVAFMADLSG